MLYLNIYKYTYTQNLLTYTEFNNNLKNIFQVKRPAGDYFCIFLNKLNKHNAFCLTSPNFSMFSHFYTCETESDRFSLNSLRKVQ